MKISIGIITARKSLENIMKSDEKMRAVADITYLAYSSTLELTRIYLENASKFDGFLFSGAYPQSYIIENVCPISKPSLCLDINDRDYYWIISKLFATNPHIDFSRVAFDSPTNFFSFDSVFPPEKMPITLEITPTGSLLSQQLQNFYESSLRVYKNFWESGAVDLFIIRLTNLADSMEANNLPYIFLSPSPATVIDCFNELVSDIRANKIQNSLTACCTIQIAKDKVLPEDYIALEKALAQFNATQNMSCVVLRNDNLFDTITSSAVVRELTSDYTTCLLTSTLYELLPFSTYIGWGIGYDIVSAHQNALRAIQESLRDSHRYTYMVNEKYEMIGPLSGDRSISYITRPGNRTLCMAKALGVSPLNLEKLISLQSKKQMLEFSSADLVFYLNITPRSATRILQKLVQHGGAQEIKHTQLNSRGRPSRIYLIDLDSLQLDTVEPCVELE